MKALTKMTPKLQEAYNEWLLLFGYREAGFDEIQNAHPILDAPGNYKWFSKCIKTNEADITWQLKTIEELNNETT